MLHILNGDAVLPIFKSTGIPGEFVVWREALCSGQVTFQIGTEAWLKKRLDHLNQDQGSQVSAHPIATQLEKIADSKSDEVVLWFDYDMFCQINQLAALAFLSQSGFNGTISLVNTKDRCLPGLELSSMKAKEWSDAFEYRQKVSEGAAEFGLNWWKHYCSDDHRPLFQMLSYSPPLLPHLGFAMLAHSGRFPRRSNGISDYEKMVLEVLSKGPLSLKELMRNIFSKTHWIGYGDTQHFRHLSRLHPFIHKDEIHYSLTAEGLSMLNGELIASIINREEFYGGCRESRHFAEDLLDIVTGI